MKRTTHYAIALLSSVAVITGIWALPAKAADLPIKAAPSPQRATAVSSWNGWYTGGYAGVQQGRSNTSVDGWSNTERLPVQRCSTNEETGEEKCHQVRHQFVNVTNSIPGASTDGNLVGATFGAYGGYNWQMQGGVVLGVELDAGWSGARETTTTFPTP